MHSNRLEILACKQNGTRSHEKDKSYIRNKSDYRRSVVWECTALGMEDSDSAGDLADSKSTSRVFSVSSGVERSSPLVGCARNKLQFHTVLLNLTLFP